MVSSGRTPKDSGPHSFSKECPILKITSSLICDVLESGFSMSKAATLERLFAGCLSTSINGMNDSERDLSKIK